MTIERKKKICVQCGFERYIFSKGRCEQCAKLVDRSLKQFSKVEKKESVSSLVEELDSVFSLFIRLRKAKVDKSGLVTVTCYTSGKEMAWKKSQCGHFISRRHMSTRFNEINCQVQSVKENMFNQGNAPEFQRRLIEEYGQAEVDKLLLIKGQTVKLDRMTLRWQIQHYGKLVDELKVKLNIQE